MTLILLIRHGIAEAYTSGAADAERALTPEGWTKTRQAMADRTYDNLQGFLRDGRMVSPAPLPN